MQNSLIRSCYLASTLWPPSKDQPESLSLVINGLRKVTFSAHTLTIVPPVFVVNYKTHCQPNKQNSTITTRSVFMIMKLLLLLHKRDAVRCSPETPATTPSHPTAALILLGLYVRDTRLPRGCDSWQASFSLPLPLLDLDFPLMKLSLSYPYFHK